MRYYLKVISEEEIKETIDALLHIFDKCVEKASRDERDEIDRLLMENDQLREVLRHYRDYK